MRTRKIDDHPHARCVSHILKLFYIIFLDQYQYLGNCAPTPPLTQQVIIS